MAARRGGIEEFRTQGIRANNDRVFALEVSGPDLYKLLQFFEHVATGNKSYLETRDAVLFAEKFRDQARAQGF